MDIDAAGGAATAGLIAGALERPGGHAGDPHGDCSDCGAPVEGNFCANCGQPAHVHRTLLHLAEEVLHGVVHFDGRIWRTLPLLILNPGRLTREWIEGRRTRYVSPLAMFLFTVFVMFFAFSLFGGHGGGETQVPIDQQIAAKSAELERSRQTLAQVQADLAEIPGGPPSYIGDTQNAALSGLERELASLRAAKAAGQTTVVAGEGWTARLSESVRNGTTKIDTGDKKLDKILTKKALNPDLAFYKIQQTAYKFSFLLIPLSIPFVGLLFLWRRGFTFYDHGVFVLYSITAMSLLFTAAALIAPLWGPLGVLAGLAVLVGPPAHMFAQLKGTYGLSVPSALWRTFMLLMFSTIAIALFITAIVTLGMTG